VPARTPARSCPRLWGRSATRSACRTAIGRPAVFGTGLCRVHARDGIPLPPAHSGRVKLSSLARNQCPVCAGTGVQFAVESVSSLAWNGCPVWRGKRTHITAIEAGLGAEIDHDVRRRPKVNGTNPGATVRIATRLSILLKDDACYDGFRRIFEARSEFVHGRTMRKIKAEDRLLARRLARRMAAELVARSRRETHPSRELFLQYLLSEKPQ